MVGIYLFVNTIILYLLKFIKYDITGRINQQVKYNRKGDVDASPVVKSQIY